MTIMQDVDTNKIVLDGGSGWVIDGWTHIEKYDGSVKTRDGCSFVTHRRYCVVVHGQDAINAEILYGLHQIAMGRFGVNSEYNEVREITDITNFLETIEI